MFKANTLLNIICLEDIENDAQLIKQKLVEFGFQVFIDLVSGEKEYVSLLKSKTYDVILADYTIPGYDIFSALKQALELQPDVPFICISGTIGEDMAVELLQSGASDYIFKDRLGRLAFAVKRALEGVNKLKSLKNSEIKLRKSEALYQAIFESTETATFISEESTEILMANKACHLITGYRPEELIGQKWNQFFAPECFLEMMNNHNLRRLNPDMAPKKYEVKLVNKNGKLRDVLLEVGMIPGTLQSIVSILDITDRNLAEQELIAAKEKAEESDRLKTSFLNNISHEIRTPFNGILGFLSIIQNNDISISERNEYFGYVNDSADRLMHTINDIVEMSQIQSGQMKLEISDTKINALTDKLSLRYGNLANKKGLEFNIVNELPAEITTFSTDGKKLKTILTNLLVNAIKFTAKGSIELKIRKRDHHLEFSVWDTGIGISKKQQDVIFELFKQADASNTRQFEGLGLGLSISKSYIKMLGGEIWLESELGKGSTFYFRLQSTSADVNN